MISIGNKMMMPKSSAWDYKGTLTVGYDSGSDDFGAWESWGWADGFYGSISPTNPQVSGFNVTNGILYQESTDGGTTSKTLYVASTYFGMAKSCNTIEIDGVEFTGFDSMGSLSVSANPFPAAGNTSSIKLR
jgi:hypothetical protein